MTNPWSIERIRSLIAERAQEDLHLDYKAAAALSKEEKKRTEISKDVSAFANADGGVIIYGVSEDPVDDSFPGAIDPVDGRVTSAEWLEQIVTSRIQPKIPGLEIHVVEIAPGQVVYVVDIPKGETAHQASDKRYHKRLGRTTIAMEDYEVRDVMGRKTTPKVRVEVSLVRRKREINAGWQPSRFTGDPFNPKQEAPKKEYVTKEWLRFRAINDGNLVIHYLNVYVEIDPPAEAPTGVVGESEPVDELYCDNTIRDVVDVHMVGYGGVEAVPKYGPSRYDPILPSLSLRLQDHNILPESYTPDTKIRWKAHADTASVVKGELLVSELEVIED